MVRKGICSIGCLVLVLENEPVKQSLVHFEKLKNIFPFLRDIRQRKFVEQVITGYLPSVIFMIFLYFVPPLMMVFSTLEGSISRSSRKRSTCIKVTYFVIWNVFFANILTETAIDHYQISIMKLEDPKNIPNLLVKAVPSTATFFMTYVLTSGWASLSVELILQNKDETTYGQSRPWARATRASAQGPKKILNFWGPIFLNIYILKKKPISQTFSEFFYVTFLLQIFSISRNPWRRKYTRCLSIFILSLLFPGNLCKVLYKWISNQRKNLHLRFYWSLLIIYCS